MISLFVNLRFFISLYILLIAWLWIQTYGIPNPTEKAINDCIGFINEKDLLCILMLLCSADFDTYYTLEKTKTTIIIKVYRIKQLFIIYKRVYQITTSIDQPFNLVDEINLFVECFSLCRVYFGDL